MATTVTMLQDISGTRNGQEWPERGQDVVLPDAEAADYVEADIAEPST